MHCIDSKLLWTKASGLLTDLMLHGTALHEDDHKHGCFAHTDKLLVPITEHLVTSLMTSDRTPDACISISAAAVHSN